MIKSIWLCQVQPHVFELKPYITFSGFKFQKFADFAFIDGRMQGQISLLVRPRGYETFFMLSSIEHEILNAHKYINNKKLGFF